MSQRFAALALAPLGAVSAYAWTAGSPAPEDTYAATIRPILAKHCFACHGPEEQKGSVQLDDLDPDFVEGYDAEEWHFALDMIQGAEMPPEQAPQLSDEDRRTLVRWIESGLEDVRRAAEGPPRPVLRRLNRVQYTHTLQDLLHLGVNFGSRLPSDSKSRSGFTNNGAVLLASPLHLDTYQEIARAALEEAIQSGERPESTRYRVRLGKGIGKGHVGAETGGYQSVPLDADDFRIDILDGEGAPRAPRSNGEEAALESIRRHISVGLRGSAQDRFRITDQGLVLLGAVPHKEVAPGAWQGPSPNAKLEMQRVFPETGDLLMRVRAGRGELWNTAKPVLLALPDAEPMVSLDPSTGRMVAGGTTLIARALSSDQRKNLRNQGDSLVPVDVPAHSRARVALKVPAEGFYQVDLAHPPAPADAMPSIRLSHGKLTLDLRPELGEEELENDLVLTTVGAAYLRAGGTHLELGGTFFTGFSEIALTPLGPEHPLVQRLDAKVESSESSVAHMNPVLRVFAGTRTDDGMDYRTFGEPAEVVGPVAEYSFLGRLENLPIPEPESGDTEILSGFLLLGLWNDHLVKDRQSPGPPLLVESIEVEAPYFPAWPPASHTSIFPPRDAGTSDRDYGEAVIQAFLERAFRRPAEPEVIARYLGFWHSIRPEYDSLEDSVREVLIAALCSPRFLYLSEPVAGDDLDGSLQGDGSTGHNSPREIDEYSLATRLSYFVWNSGPDQRLLDHAAAGTLRASLDGELARMLDDPRTKRFVDAFADEWLRLDRLEQMTVDPRRYPAFTRFVKRDMRAETVGFLGYVLGEDLDVANLIDSDFALLNQNLAEFYGVDGVAGPHFRPVPIPRSEGRGGLLSQGSFLVGHSDGVQPHPIKRAVWLKERILGDPPPPPPPNVPDLDPDTPGFDKLTLKEQLEAHRDNPSCRDCHAGIDPYGVAFERYSAVGLFEPERKGRPVDASTTLPDGTPIDGIAPLKSYLLTSQRDQVTLALIEHLYAYALGRDVSFVDEEDLEAIRTRVAAEGGRFRAVIEGIVHSPAFHR